MTQWPQGGGEKAKATGEVREYFVDGVMGGGGGVLMEKSAHTVNSKHGNNPGMTFTDPIACVGP